MKLHNNQTLRNVSVFISFEAVDEMIGVMSDALVSSLIEKTNTAITVKSLKVRSTSSNPTLYGDFSYKVGRYTFDLTARYNEDEKQWKLI